MSDRVDDLHGPKAGRIPPDSIQSDELDLISDEVLDSLTELIKYRIKEELGRLDYSGSEDSAAGGQQDNDFGNHFKLIDQHRPGAERQFMLGRCNGLLGWQLGAVPDVSQQRQNQSDDQSR